MEGFEVFTGSARAVRSSGPKVLISPQSVIRLNPAALELFGEEPPETVELLFNPEQRIVAIRAAATENATAIKLRKQINTTSRFITARTFVRKYDIPSEKGTEFDAYLFSDGVVAFNLEDAEPSTRSRKSGK